MQSERLHSPATRTPRLSQSWFLRRQLRLEPELSRFAPGLPGLEFRVERFRAAMNSLAPARRCFRTQPRSKGPSLAQPAPQPRAHRQARAVARRAAAPAQALWVRSVAETSFRGPHAKTDYWQIPHERCAVAPPRQARGPVSTLRRGSRRTENGNLGAWKGEFRRRRNVCEGLELSGTR
jgi:hypothetical protein